MTDVNKTQLVNVSEAPLPDIIAPSSSIQMLELRNAELAEAVAARDAFIAVAAHELRNPMTPMLGQLELLLAGLSSGRYGPAMVAERLRRLHEAMRHYIKRTTILLDMSRITSGNFRLDPSEFDLCELIGSVATAYAAAAARAGSPIMVGLPGAIAGTWDRLALEQIIDNLTSNAIKYAGGAPIEIAARGHDETVTITIRDHGPGISTKDQARIFERFERAAGHGDGQSGFGVGLWVVGQLVQAMKGNIMVDEAAGGGTVFTVTLPRRVELSAG